MVVAAWRKMDEGEGSCSAQVCWLLWLMMDRRGLISRLVAGGNRPAINNVER